MRGGLPLKLSKGQGSELCFGLSEDGPPQHISSGVSVKCALATPQDLFQEDTEQGLVLYLGTALPHCLESIRTYRSDVSRNILGVASTEQRGRGSLFSIPCPGMTLRFLTSNGLCHGVSRCSRSPDQCFEKYMFVEPCDHKWPEWQGFAILPVSKQYWKVFSGQER